MSNPSAIDLHRVFPVEIKGDTVIVTPKGDAVGFGHTEVQQELSAIEQLLKQSNARHLIVDLRHANYFGSEMIGLINQLGLQGRESGGRIALCNASADMRDILRVMNFDTIWEFYDTRALAVRQLVTEPFSQKLSSFRGVMVAVIALGVVGLILFYYPWSDPNVAHYQTLMRISKQLEQMRMHGSSREKWAGFRKQARAQIDAVLNETAAGAKKGKPAESALYKAGKEGLIPLLGTDRAGVPRFQAVFDQSMEEAAAQIEDLTDLPPQPPPVKTRPKKRPQAPKKDRTRRDRD